MTLAPAVIDSSTTPTLTQSGTETHNTPFAALSLDSNAEELPIHLQEPAEVAGGTASQAVLTPTELEGSYLQAEQTNTAYVTIPVAATVYQPEFNLDAPETRGHPPRTKAEREGRPGHQRMYRMRRGCR